MKSGGGPTADPPASTRAREGDLHGGRPDGLHRQRFLIDPMPPFRLDLTAWALRRRPGNAVDRWDGTSYRRALALTDGLVGCSVTQDADAGDEAASPSVVLTSGRIGEAVEADARSSLERMLGLRLDLTDFYQLAAADDRIGPLVAHFRGLKAPRFPTVFESLLNAVACQQLSLEAGLSLLNRLTAAYGQGISPDGRFPLAFPRPEDLASLEHQALRELGFSFRKAATIIDLARAVVEGRIDVEGLEHLADDEVISRLTHLNGIGRWSAEYVLLRGLGRLHVFPGDDVGARNNLARWFGVTSPLDYDTVRQVVSPWWPFAGMVYFHLLLGNLEAVGELDHAPPLLDGDSRPSAVQMPSPVRLRTSVRQG